MGFVALPASDPARRGVDVALGTSGVGVRGVGAASGVAERASALSESCSGVDA